MKSSSAILITNQYFMHVYIAPILWNGDNPLYIK